MSNPELKEIRYGDEWSEYSYKGVVIFYTSCGCSGCYVNNSFVARTLEETIKILDKEKVG